MKIKILFLILCSLFNQKLNPIEIDISVLFKWATILSVPPVLSYVTKFSEDNDEHIDIRLLALSCGSLLSSFDQIVSLNPKLIEWARDAIIKSISLLLCNKARKQDRKGSRKDSDSSIRKVNRGLTDYIIPGLYIDEFISKFTKYLLVFNSFNLIMSKIIPKKV